MQDLGPDTLFVLVALVAPVAALLGRKTLEWVHEDWTVRAILAWVAGVVLYAGARLGMRGATLLEPPGEFITAVIPFAFLLVGVSSLFFALIAIWRGCLLLINKFSKPR